MRGLIAFQLLDRAREILAEPLRWSQWSPARDLTDAPVRPTDLSAVRWSIWGAMAKAREGLRDRYCRSELSLVGDEWRGAETALAVAAGGDYTAFELYTEREHWEVVSLLDRAVESIQREVLA